MKSYKIGKRFEEMEYEEMASSQAIDSVNPNTYTNLPTITPALSIIPTLSWCPTFLP